MHNRFSTGLIEAQAERLSLLAEECAEVIQVVGKILRHGFDTFNPLLPVSEDEYPITNRMLLEKELGHVLNVQRMMWRAGDISKDQQEIHADQKADKIARWLHYQE